MNVYYISAFIVFIGFAEHIIIFPLSGINQILKLGVIVFLNFLVYFKRKKIPISALVYILLMLMFDISISLISLSNNNYTYNVLASCFQGLVKRSLSFYLPILILSGLFNKYSVENNLKEIFSKFYLKVSFIFAYLIFAYSLFQIIGLDIPGIPFGEYGTGSLKLTFLGIVFDDFSQTRAVRPQVIFSEANYLALFMLPSFFFSLKYFEINKLKTFILLLSIFLTGSLSVMFGLVTGITLIIYRYKKSISILISTIIVFIVPKIFIILSGEFIDSNFIINYLQYRFGSRGGSVLDKLASIEWAIKNTPDLGLGVLDFSQVNKYLGSSDLLINTTGSFFNLYTQYGKLFFIPLLITLIFIFYKLYINKFSINQWIYTAIIFSIINSSWIHSNFHTTFLTIFLSLAITEPIKKRIKFYSNI